MLVYSSSISCWQNSASISLSGSYSVSPRAYHDVDHEHHDSISKATNNNTTLRLTPLNRGAYRALALVQASLSLARDKQIRLIVKSFTT